MAQEERPSGIVVQLGVATVRMRPVGLVLYAHEFWIAGTSMPRDSQARGNTTFTPVPYYLFCRALELALKAYLLAMNVADERALKKSLGHDLDKLWREAKAHGIIAVVGNPGPDFESDLAGANAYYKGKAFEYFDFHRWAGNYRDLPPFDRFRAAIKQVVEETKEYCFTAC